MKLILKYNTESENVLVSKCLILLWYAAWQPEKYAFLKFKSVTFILFFIDRKHLPFYA